jgi:hypothetical protein
LLRFKFYDFIIEQKKLLWNFRMNLYFRQARVPRGVLLDIICNTSCSVTGMVVTLQLLGVRDMLTDKFYDIRQRRSRSKNATYPCFLKDRNVMVSDNPAY